MYGSLTAGDSARRAMLNELPHAETDILLQRALIADSHGVLDGPGQRRGVGKGLFGRRAPDVRDGQAGHHVVTGERNGLHGHPQLLRHREQPFGVDGLHVPMLVSADCHRPHRWRWRLPRPRARAQPRRLVADHRQRCSLDVGHQPVDLDRVGQVVEEENQRPQAREQQHDRDGHGKLRVGATRLGPRRRHHGVKAGGRVGEGGHDHRQAHLVGPVAQEVAQHPRRVLSRGHLQRNQGEPEDQGDDRDYRAGDPDQQRPGVLRAALEQQVMQGRTGAYPHP